MSAMVETDWGEIYTNYYDKIFHYIKRRVRYIDLCEELTHDVFIKAIAADGKGVGSQSHFNGWLYRIAHNLIVDHYRARERIRELPLDVAFGLSDPSADLVEMIGESLEIEKVLNVISQLTEEQQKVIFMRFLDECDFDEIAQALDKNRDSIKALQFRALTNINKLLGGTGRPSKEPGKSKEIKKILCEHGPLPVKDIATIADISASKVNSALYGRNSMFCKVGVKDDKRVTIYIWGVIGIHDKEAA